MRGFLSDTTSFDAASWKTKSLCFTRGRTVSKSRTSPEINSNRSSFTRCRRFFCRLATKLSRATTFLAPCASDSVQMWLPMNPAPPVTSTVFPVMTLSMVPFLDFGE